MRDLQRMRLHSAFRFFVSFVPFLAITSMTHNTQQELQPQAWRALVIVLVIIYHTSFLISKFGAPKLINRAWRRLDARK